MNTIAKFKALLGLAQADGEFDLTEKDFIRYLAGVQGLSSSELKELLKNEDKMRDLTQELDFDDKIDILTYLVKLMKVDGKVLLSEIEYCEKMAKLLGFEEKSIGFLSGIVEGNPHTSPNFGRIKYRMRKYLAAAA